MEDSYVLTLEGKESHFPELHLCFCGRSVCHPDHRIGPAAHPAYVLHYILDGKGRYHIDGRTYTLEKDQGFLMEPNVVSSYEADTEQPWSYLWIGFEGGFAKELLEQLGLTHQELTFSADCGEQLLGIVENMLTCEAQGIEQECFLQSQLFQFFACLSHDLSTRSNAFRQDKQNYYVRMAEEFIRSNYASDIRVPDIAEAVGISRSYLTSLFQNILQTSPSEYLTAFRLTRGHEQLAITDLPVSRIAELCGYRDPLVFSKAFKQMTGMTPTQYRKTIREERKINIQHIRGKK